MTDNNFDIKILDLHWIKDVDDPTDLCVHGHVFVKIGDEVVADKDSLDVTVSSTALYLLRTIKDNYKKDDYASQLLPCCGLFDLTTAIYNQFLTQKSAIFDHIAQIVGLSFARKTF